MLRYPCLVLDHDDTAVQSEATVNFPFFQYILGEFRPGTEITLETYTKGCFTLGFAEMCRKWYGFTEQELADEYNRWQKYIALHRPLPYPGIRELIKYQKAEGGLICVVSHSCASNIMRDYSANFSIVPDEIYGWDYPEELRKPSPYPLEQIMKNYGLHSQELLVIDDMKPGWEMAKKASVPVAFAAWGRKGFPDIVKEMSKLCDYTFYTVEELTNFLFD